MSDERDWLAEAKARCEAATPGNWEVGGNSFAVLMVDHDAKKQAFVGFPLPPFGTPHSRENAEFIAHAHADIPRAVAALEAADALASLVEAYQNDVTEDPDGHDWVKRMLEIDSALAAYKEARK